MSTTAKNPDALSPVFAGNVGPDETVVYSGPLHFYETEAEKYDIHIPITPFRYDPAAGNLLIDIFNYAPLLSRRDPDWAIDYAERPLDSVSALCGKATDTSGFASTAGMMTRFTYTPIPEPSTWALLATALTVLGVLRFTRRGQTI
ncbi:MAG TPA: PEP-CTERM sorting domain-containing protein [Verrucomicrobiae bacterium]|nr:PEP-CTERM sorting domain-containing protein [Verrucomicrobiae bacterium]